MADPTEPDGKKPPPTCKAILMCDQVITDMRTKKNSIIGIFDRLTFPSFPGVIPPFHVFIQFVDGIGRYNLTIEIHDLRNAVVIARMENLVVEFPERTNRANLVFLCPPLPLPHDGGYDLVILTGSREIEKQRFDAVLPEGPSDGHDAPDPPNDAGE